MSRTLALYYLFLPMMVGCTEAALGQTDKPSSLFVGQPTIRPNPVKRAPLIAIMDVRATQSVDVSVQVSDSNRTWELPWHARAASIHSIPILGMRPDTKHKITVTVKVPGTAHTETSNALNFHTAPLPESFPPLKTLIAKPEKMEPGITMFGVNLWQDNNSLLDYGYLIALDSEGEVVWYCHTTDRTADLRLLKNGHLLYQQGSYRYVYEIDLLGQDYRRWVATNLTELPDPNSIPIRSDTLHHDTLEMPNGNFLTLTTELNRFAEFPTSEKNPNAPWEPAHVVCDAIIEVDPSSGKIVDRLPLVDLLDRKRFGYMAMSGFWKDKYNDDINDLSRDWSHANALLYLPDEQSVIVSLRHLDCLLKIDWRSKKIRWILGDPSGWGEPWQKFLLKPMGNLQWFYHQHSPQLTPRGTLLMFDNGNYRARPFDEVTFAPQNQSRVVEFRINEEKMSVEQIYEFRGVPGDTFYSPFYCEADWLSETQNILITDGGRIELADGTPSDDVPSARQWARIFEITRTDPPEKVFEVSCDSGLGSRFGWSIYRANRFANLYDGFSLKPPPAGSSVQLFERKPHVKKYLNTDFDRKNHFDLQNESKK